MFRIIVFLFGAVLSAGMPARSWAAEASARLNQLEKSLAAVRADNERLGRQVDEKGKALEARLSELEKGAKAPQGAQSVEQFAKATMDSASLVITFVGMIFSALGIIGGILAFVGFREFKQMKAQRLEAERTLDSAVLLARASHSLIQADAIPDEEKNKETKKLRVLVGLHMIEELLKRGYDEPAIYNWKAVALKRLGDVHGALQAVENILSKGKATEGSYEFRRALYNKACYLALLAQKEEDKTEAYRLLQRAVTGDYHLGQIALQDKDFANLDRTRLQSLVGAVT